MEDFIDNLHDIIYGKYKLSNFTNNSLCKGLTREEVIRNLLKDLLPPFFLVGSGKIIDSKRKYSKQQDIIIYNILASSFKFEEIEVYPADAICATIEVKSKLDKKELKKSMENIKSVKQLNMVGEPGAYIGEWNKKIIGNIFAFESINIKKLKEDLTSLKTELKLKDFEMPDNICILNKYLITNNKYLREKMNCKDDYVFIILNKKSLFIFLDILVTNMNKPLYSTGIFMHYLTDATGYIHFDYLDPDK